MSCILGLSPLHCRPASSSNLHAAARIDQVSSFKFPIPSRRQQWTSSNLTSSRPRWTNSRAKAETVEEDEEVEEKDNKVGLWGRSSSSAVVPHEDYGEVKKILGCRVNLDEREMEYLIEWEDDHPETWEPAENIASDVLSEFLTPWWSAAKKSDETKLAELLDEEGRDVDAIDENERTALLFAAGLGSESCVRMLVEAGADVNWQDRDGFSALHIAAGYVHSNVVRALLELGADPEVTDSKGRSCLKLAQDLLERTPRGNPLQFARRLALEQVVKVLDEACFETVAVDQVLDKRMAAGNKVEYLVKWSDDSEESWLPAADIADDLVKDYEAGLEYGIVEKILEKRLQGDTVEYRVKWADSENDSWEPKENLATELVAEFESSLTKDKEP